MAGEDRDFYQILGVDRNASQAAIKDAYDRLRKRTTVLLNNHKADQKDPSLVKEGRKMAEVAYETLSNPTERRIYNDMGHKAYMATRNERSALPSRNGKAGGAIPVGK